MRKEGINMISDEQKRQQILKNRARQLYKFGKNDLGKDIYYTRDELETFFDKYKEEKKPTFLSHIPYFGFVDLFFGDPQQYDIPGIKENYLAELPTNVKECFTEMESKFIEYKNIENTLNNEAKNNIVKAYNEELPTHTYIKIFDDEINIVKEIKNRVYKISTEYEKLDEKIPIFITSDIIKKIKDHNVSLNTFNETIEKMLNPICVLQGSSVSTMILILDIKNENDEQILVSIKLNTDRNGYDIDFITSSYWRENFDEYFYRQLLNHNLLAINKDTIKKIVSSTTQYGAMIALTGSQLTIYDNSIANNTDSVKTIFNNNYENKLLEFETDSRFFRPVMKISNAELDLYLKENNKTSFDIKDTNEIENLVTWKDHYNEQKINEYLYGGDGTRSSNGGAENTPNIVNENSTVDENNNNNNDTTRQEQTQTDTIDTNFSNVDFLDNKDLTNVDYSNVELKSTENINAEYEKYLPNEEKQNENAKINNNEKTNKKGRE